MVTELSFRCLFLVTKHLNLGLLTVVANIALMIVNI